MNKEELERVGYIVMNDKKESDNSYLYNHIYKVTPDYSFRPNERFLSKLDSKGSSSNGWENEQFRLAIPQEIEMYKQAGKPVDVITYKMEKEDWCVEITNNNQEIVHNYFKTKIGFSCDQSIGQVIGYRGGGPRWCPRCSLEGDVTIISTEEFYAKIGYVENEVKYVKSLHESQDYELNKIYKIKEIRKEVYICESANNASKLKIYFEPSTKEAFERQNTPSVAYIKVDGKTIRIVKNIVVHEVNLTIENKIVEIPIRKKNKNKVKMEILNSPQIIEL